jgi:sugar/nucleoside kinase (ribokinase family)
MSTLKSIADDGLLYDHIIGTGGIGSGIFFSLSGNDTLGREESRMAKLLPYKDYCKLHIILHYYAVLLKNEHFEVVPIGGVGNDESGRRLIDEMSNVGMNTGNIKISADRPTLFSVCYQYPDHGGGNITTEDSASSDVLPEDIDRYFANNDLNGKKEILLAAPEVPLTTRIRLLEHGKKRGSLNVASVSSAEIDEFDNQNGFGLCDILFINSDEAAHIAESDNPDNKQEVAVIAIRKLIEKNNNLTVFITCGSAGVFCYSEKHLEFFPAVSVEVKSTAGAGDAFLAGTVAGMCCGLPLLKTNSNDKTLYSTATELGILVAAISVTSQDTIHHGLNTDMIFDFIKERNINGDESFVKLFL